jgi:hypothetical protein
MIMKGSILNKLLVVANFAARRRDLCKDISVPSGDSCQEGCTVTCLKRWLSRHLWISFYISKHVLVENYAFMSECLT